MGDAAYVRGEHDRRVILAAAANSGEMRQLADGRAAVMQGQAAASSGDTRTYKTDGQHVCTKTSGFVGLDGGRAYWDYSANAINYKKVNDRDFYAGRFVGDSASGDTECTINLNVPENLYDIDVLRDAALSVPTGTQAAGSTGFGLPQVHGGARALILTATSEVQCIDLLSVDKFDKNANAIIEAIFRVGANGSTNAVDFNIGIANGTSASDADAITESVFVHIDGGALDLLAESDDGTTEVNATDTTVDFVVGSAVANRVEVWIDTRDTANVKIYVNGSRVLSGSTFKIDAATGPFGLLAHLEKSTGTATAGPIYIDRLCARFAEQ